MAVKGLTGLALSAPKARQRYCDENNGQRYCDENNGQHTDQIGSDPAEKGAVAPKFNFQT